MQFEILIKSGPRSPVEAVSVAATLAGILRLRASGAPLRMTWERALGRHASTPLRMTGEGALAAKTAAEVRIAARSRAEVWVPK